MDFGSMRSVAVLPFANLSRETVAADRVRDVFVTMLLATGAVYVVPHGEVVRNLGALGVQVPSSPSIDEVVKLGKALKVDALVTGTVREYGEVRSGTAAGNVVSLSIQIVETATGKVVWAASSTQGGVSAADRLLGSGGTPMNQVTEAAVNDLLNKLFK
jgi:polysaccharide biosynthesis protein PelC